MGFLINIDNGGTLTDILVADGSEIYYTKTLTTPYDLSQCFFEGIRRVSARIYGKEDVAALLQNTECVRYSTTQGTNALVERKGPRLGLILRDGEDPGFLIKTENHRGLLAALVGDRIQHVALGLTDQAFETGVVRSVNALTAAGATRLVISLTTPDYVERERAIKRLLLRAFPRHLLGAVPMVFSHEVVDDPAHDRRTWTTLFNSFLHPAMETFLYNAEHRIRGYKSRQPLRIFRNDGASARVAKTVAIKTYSSGPRGGIEGGKALATQYGVDRLLTVDVGGTTTDICLVEHGEVRQRRHGEVEKVPMSFPLSDIVSVGIGGSSIIRAVDGAIVVGPGSVGAAPGPACFGRGGTLATITDVNLLLGLFDTASFFGGELTLDAARSRHAVEENVARPLGLTLEAALLAMEDAWIEGVARAIRDYAGDLRGAQLAAFGGAGPMAVCRIAERIGVRRIIVPRLAAVFSAFGISFSNIAHSYQVTLKEPTDAALRASLQCASAWAERDMFAESVGASEYRTAARVVTTHDGRVSTLPLDGGCTLPGDAATADEIVLEYHASKELPRPALPVIRTCPRSEPRTRGTRRVYGVRGAHEIPVCAIADQQPGAGASGPVILEETYFTCRVPSGWRFELSAARDILLEREESAS